MWEAYKIFNCYTKYCRYYKASPYKASQGITKRTYKSNEVFVYIRHLLKVQKLFLNDCYSLKQNKRILYAWVDSTSNIYIPIRVYYQMLLDC